MAKLPWMKWYNADYKRDTRRLTLEERGAWHEILMALHDSSTRGRLSMTVSRWASEISTDEKTFERCIQVLEELEICDPIRRATNEGQKHVMIESRRMLKEESRKRANTKAVKRYRKKFRVTSS